ncbi:MAG: efflux RND transporter periplasmic adaptor subunit [Steroidobacteraceae bacterium]
MSIKCWSLLMSSLLVAACGQSGSGPTGAASSANGMGSGMGPGGPGGQQASITVDTTVPTNSNAPQTLDTAGGIYAWQEVAVGSEVSGYRISEVMVDVGDTVAAGAVLAKLDDTLLREAYNQAQAALAVAKASLDQAKANAQRGNALQSPGVISKQDAEALNTTAATALAQYNNAESLLQTAKQRLDYTLIHAPDAGVISARTVVPGQIANSGTTLFSLIRQSRVEWRAEVPASAIAKLRKGMNATIKRADGTLAKGVVRTVSPGIDSNTQRGTAYIDLKLEQQIRPGMYVSGTIEMDKTNSLQVPLSAVTVRDGFSYVFVAKPDNQVRQQRVTVGRLLGELVEILEGLNAGDRVVANGVGLLRDGDRVTVAGTDTAKANSVETTTKTTP